MAYCTLKFTINDPDNLIIRSDELLIDLFKQDTSDKLCCVLKLTNHFNYFNKIYNEVIVSCEYDYLIRVYKNNRDVNIDDARFYKFIDEFIIDVKTNTMTDYKSTYTCMFTPILKDQIITFESKVLC